MVHRMDVNCGVSTSAV